MRRQIDDTVQREEHCFTSDIPTHNVEPEPNHEEHQQIQPDSLQSL
jgi:hypothetical protein